MLKRFLKAFKSAGYCQEHTFLTKSPVCCQCGYNIVQPIIEKKSRKKGKKYGKKTYQ